MSEPSFPSDDMLPLHGYSSASMKSGSIIQILANRRIAIMLPLGFASGLPLALTSGTLQAWLTVAGLDLKRRPGLRVMTPARCGRPDRHSFPSRRRCRSPLRKRPASGLPLVARARCSPVLPIAQTALRGHLSPAKRYGAPDRPNLAYNEAPAGPAMLARVRRGARTSPCPSGNLPVHMNKSP